LETLFTHDARQQVPLRNIPFSKQKNDLERHRDRWQYKKKKMTSYSLNAFPILVEECAPFRLPYEGQDPQI